MKIFKILILISFSISFLFSNNSMSLSFDKEFFSEYSKLQWKDINLSQSEKKWLEKNHKIRVRIGNWPPYMYWEDGSAKGITVDYLKVIAHKNNLNMEFMPRKYSFDKAKSLLIEHKEIDVLPMITNNEERRKSINFTRDYIFNSWVIITRQNDSFVGGLEDLRGKSVATVKGYHYNKFLNEKYPEIKLIPFNTDEEAIRALSLSQTDAFIGIVAIATYMIQKDNITNLKIAASAAIEDDTNAIGVRKDWPELSSIIDKTFDAMPLEVHNLIKQNTLSLKYEYGISKADILKGLFIIVFIGIILLLILRNNNRRLKQIINSSIEGVVVFKGRKLVAANEPLEKLFGYTPKEAFGKDILDFVDKKYHKLIAQNLETSKDPYEVEMVKKDGTVFPALVRGTNIGNGKRISAVIDLSELKKAQNELKELNETLEDKIKKEVQRNREKDRLLFQQSKLAAMGEMINNIAHQWRQPLNEINSIVMALDLELMKKKNKDDSYEKMLNSIEIQTEYMSETITNFSRYFTPERTTTEFYLSETVEDALSILDQGFKLKNIEIEYKMKKDKVLEGFPSELVQVLIILLNNATDALFEKREDNRKISITIDSKIIVEDNAGGIDESIINRIFEPYFTTKHKSKGTGVGLYMAKMIVEDSMKGIIEVKNTEYGAKFIVSLYKFSTP